MRIIMTGGTGYIGSYLAQELSADGHEIIVLSRNPHNVPNRIAKIRYERWDANTPENWGNLVEGAYAILNFAGENLAGDGFLPARWTPERKRSILESRAKAGKAISDAIKAARQKPDVLIQASAIGYYGVDKHRAFVESDPAGTDFQARVCIAWENSVADVASMGVRVILARTGLVLSADSRSILTRLLLPFKLFAGGNIGDGQQWLSWIHQVDYGRSIRHLLNNANANGAYNLTAPTPIRNAEFTQIVGKVLHRPALIPTPALAFKLAFGEIATLVIDGVQVIPARLIEEKFTFQFSDFESALRNLTE